MKTIPKSNFLGINNRLPQNALTIRTRESSGTYLRDAVNVDVDDAKQLRSRKAAALVQALTAPHGLYTTGDGAHYLVRASVLYRVTLPTYSETLVAILASNERMSYVEYDGSLYFSNGTDSGRITGGVVYPLGLPTPAMPTVTELPHSGGLFAGKYQVCVSYVNAATGEEGGVSAARSVVLSADGGLRVAVPAATAGATHANLYVSDINGSVLHLAASPALGTATVDVIVKPTGRPANRRFEKPIPAGTLFMMNGMLCSFKGKEVFEGIPARPGYYIPVNEREVEGGRLRFPTDVSNVVPTPHGAYVVADKTYWFAGPQLTKAEKVVDLLPYGGVLDTAFHAPDKPLVGWFGNKGVVLGTPTGEVTTPMADKIDLTLPTSGVSVVWQDDYFRVVSCGWCVNLALGAATRYTGYDFTSISGNYATAADGIYQLDVDGPVEWLIDFGREDFGSENEKRLPAVYAGVDCEDPVTLRVTTPNGEDYSYDARSAGGGLNVHRIDPGKGLRSNWYGLELSGLSELKTLASVSFAPTASQRRI